MIRRSFIVGTAGHIDHGKTRLVEALTGTNTDRLKEEIQRGITIDLGFAHAQVGDFQVGFVDVPGHERFVKNMLAGAGGVQFVMLVVAADESIMPQTREHFQICRLLGASTGMVVITKKDLVESELVSLVEEEVKDLVQDSFLSDAPIVAVDSRSGDGIDALLDVLARRLARIEDTSAQLHQQLFRLPVDRVFSLRGFGTIVTGTPCAGKVGKEHRVQAYPGPRVGRIRNIQVYGANAEEASIGQRTALNVVGIEKEHLLRGMVLAPPDALSPASMLDVWVELLETAPAALHTRAPVRLHQGSDETIGRFYPIGAEKELAPGKSGLAQIRLERPAVVCVGDRFILRRYSPLTTIGGGIVLDPAPRKHRRQEALQIAPALHEISRCWRTGSSDRVDRTLGYLVARSGPAGVSFGQLAARTGCTPEQVTHLLDSRPDITLMTPPGIAVDSAQLEELKTRLLQEVGAHHRQHPLSRGVSREELKDRVMGQAQATYYATVLQSLESDQRLRVTTHTVSLFEHNIDLTPQQKEVTGRMLETFSSRQPGALTLPEIASQIGRSVTDIQDLFFFLVQDGSIIRISDQLFVSREQLEIFRSRLQATFPTRSTFGVGDFKDLFGLTRKLAIPLLEYMDRTHLTRRVGDQRQVL